MDITTKYDLGDYVYPISKRIKKVKIPTNCPACNDEGSVKINDKTYLCPDCRGYAYHTIDGDTEWCVEYKAGKIGKINIELYSPKYKRESHYKYMLNSTGVGSGQLWKEEDLLLSEEETQAECDRRNKLE